MSVLVKMSYNIDWIIPNLRNPTRLWSIASTITVAAVGLFSKILIRKYYIVQSAGGVYLVLLLEWLNRTKIYNKHIISTALQSRPRHVPLITISNHHSCFDDPGIWGK